ncbi:hypothetical protein AXG93_4720s1090 [Marchantia polymorpha subsp. ruderalis]|uniref:Uncharacterized protein n=1 Tax=Marchantia polymorpha subsp. ruderalis TaxID=1480154 RepID=A0A176VRZ5_MARPO|nr:hypothetical protein AXG93_4720s1090 [Marchantia polymorpha subsp. ruderalis]
MLLWQNKRRKEKRLKRIPSAQQKLAEIFKNSMIKSIPLRMVPLRVPQVGLRAFQDELTAVKLDILLWGWNWEEEISIGALFKNCKSSKNKYRTRDYVDRKWRNVAVALLQILQPHRTTYMTSWQVGFVERALVGDSNSLGSHFVEGHTTACREEKGVSINHLSLFLINFYRSIRSLTVEEKIQFPLLSRANPGRLVRDVEVDTDLNEVPASTPPARLRTEEESRGARAPWKRKWEGDIEPSRRELLAVPVKHRANNEQIRPKQKARKLILPADSSADTGRVAVARDSPFFGEDFRVVPLALKPLEHIPTGKGRNAETRLPSTEAPLVIPDRDDVVGPPGAEDDTPSEEGEVKSVRGTPTGVLCEQVVPLLRYLDRKTTKYGDPFQCGSYVELVQNRTRIKVATNPELIVLDQKYRQLGVRYNFLQDECALSRKLQKTAIQLRDEIVSNVQRKIDELRAKVQTEISAKQAQNRILTEEVVRHTHALEQSEAARRADEELLGRLQSQCVELRTQRAAAELQLAEVEGHNRRATDRTREELVSRVDRCLRGYAGCEIAARERMTLCELEMRATALMTGDGQSRRRVAKRLKSFMSRSRDAIAILEAGATEVLRRLGLRRRADEWTGRELVGRRPAHMRHSR